MTGSDTAATPDAVVDEHLAAYNAGDTDAFVETFHPDAVVADLDDGAVQAAGREEIREVWGYLFENAPDLHCEFTDRLRFGEYVVCEERVTGIETPMSALAVYHVVDGRIQRLWLAEEKR